MAIKLFRILLFFFFLWVYATVLYLLCYALPFALVGGVLIWGLLRKPMRFPQRVRELRTFALKVGELLASLLEALVAPLVKGI